MSINLDHLDEFSVDCRKMLSFLIADDTMYYWNKVPSFFIFGGKL